MLKDWNLFEKTFLIGGSIIMLILSILAKNDLLTTVYGLLSVTSAIYIAKGKVIGNFLGAFNGLIYAYFSLRHKIYSEAIISIFIIFPITVYGIISWIRNQNAETKTITINRLTNKEIFLAVLSQVIMYFGYYFLLKYFNTDRLFLSALSICISVLAFYFLSRMTVLAYYTFIIKDTIATLLWLYPLLRGETGILTVFISNIIFLINDIYGVVSWKNLAKKQNQ
ncbi:MAG TPA: nicotinamide riboside transporter PnuC [Erysipelotrichaceae bacterium]|jgi:nicotinamide mononucleotide transporter PnuC|nr:nicotinamide riboside transporter PnuC [Erysipelotrichaceae bacterium]HQB31917.1 nicotinamide riboside transporter PnuC [Erysipelotrichaceae bacterium]